MKPGAFLLLLACAGIAVQHGDRQGRALVQAQVPNAPTELQSVIMTVQGFPERNLDLVVADFGQIPSGSMLRCAAHTCHVCTRMCHTGSVLPEPALRQAHRHANVWKCSVGLEPHHGLLACRRPGLAARSLDCFRARCAFCSEFIGQNAI